MFDCRRIRFQEWLPAVTLFASMAIAVEAFGVPTEEGRLHPAPDPMAVSRKELPAVFRQTGPASIADLKAIEKHIQGLIARATPSVVAVEIGGGTGTGVIVSPDGLVLTVAHLCGEVNRRARLIFTDGKAVKGKVIGVDEENDAGLIRITDHGRWPFAPLGELDSLEVGDWTLALGHPGGFETSRSLVVRLGRLIRISGNNLQSDCTITLGDSGGPLLDMHGRVIGIHTSIRGSMAQNYHVPITDFLNGWEQLVKADIAPELGSPRSYLGAKAVDERGDCRINEVVKDGPAFEAGLEVGDIVLKVDGREIRTAASLERRAAEAIPGETLMIEVKRGGKVLTLRVRMKAPTRSRI